MKYILFSISFIILGSFCLLAQPLTKEDYARAVSFEYSNYNNKTAFNLSTNVDWSKDGKFGIFSDFSEEGRRYKKVDLASYEISDLFDHEKLAELLGKKVDSLSISDISLEGDSLLFEIEQQRYLLTLGDYILVTEEAKKPKGGERIESKSPDGLWIAFVRDYNLYIKSVEDDAKEFQLSFDGAKNYEYASYYGWYDIMEGENGDRPANFAVNWSPDSKFIQANLIDLRTADKMYMLDFSKDDKYRPSLHSYYRGSPGDTNMVMLTPKFYDIDQKKEIALPLKARTHINSLWTRWTESSGIVLAQDTERGFQKNTVQRIDLNTGKIKDLFKEESNTNIDAFQYWFLEKHQKIVFLSQRSGWNQLYSFDLKNNKIASITEGDFVVNDVVNLDEEQGVFWIAASGFYPEMNPYYQQIFKVNLEGKMDLLTPEKLHHDVNFSDNHKYFIDQYSNVQTPTITVLRSSETGEILAELTRADVKKLYEKGWNPPMVFSLIAKDGITKIYGAVWKPTNFDANKKYPIIDHSYTGPHTQVFPKSFRQALMNQALAELGFVVVMVDGLGTAGRSKAFLNYSYKNMGKNLEDHVLAIKSLAEKNSWIDIDKVGIFGHSAGGYDAGHGILAFPDFYKVAVASSGDHDFRMEKAWWPEMYMGWPVDSTYEEVSNITIAGNLKGKLLLVHGNMDDNVNVSATYKLAEALIKADKEFDLLILPSQRHGYVGNHRQYFTKKRWNYFVENLLGQEAIWDFDWE